MRKVISYIACSLNGKIARENGDVDWLENIPNPEESDYGYYEFYDTIDTTIMGYATYKQVIDWEIAFPYKGKENYVFTRESRGSSDDVQFITKDHIQFLEKLKKKKGKDIWLVGGAQLNSLILKHKLIDELWIHLMPVLLPEGIDLFTEILTDTSLTLKSTSSYKSGVVGLQYIIE